MRPLAEGKKSNQGGEILNGTHRSRNTSEKDLLKQVIEPVDDSMGSHPRFGREEEVKIDHLFSSMYAKNLISNIKSIYSLMKPIIS